MDADDNIRLVDQITHEIMTLDKGGTLLSNATSGTTGLEQPFGIAIDAFGNSVVTEGRTFRITTLDSAGTVISSFDDFTHNSFEVAVDSDGNYILAQAGFRECCTGVGGRLARFTPSGTFIEEFGDGEMAGTSLGVVVDPISGQFYASDSTADRVLLFDADGTFNSVFATGGFTQTSAVAVDTLGRVYVADIGQIVRVFAQDGAPLATINPNFTTWGIAIDSEGRVILSNGARLRIFVVFEDTTPPEITPVVSGTLGGQGWYRSDVTVSWSVIDNESDVFPTGGCDTTIISTDTNGTTLTCSAQSAGGSASESFTVKRDTVGRTITAVRDPATANANGWNDTPVTVTFTCSDDPGPVASGNASCTSPVTINDGAGQSATGFAVDVAGNSASVTISDINVDTTPPEITPVVSGTLGGQGWYRSDVTVSWSVIDNESDVFSTGGCDATIISTDTNGTTLTCSAESGGGSASESFTVKRDTVGRTITAVRDPATANANWWNDTPVTVTFTCSDDPGPVASGNASCTSPVTINEGAGQSATGFGVDVAGNSTSVTIGDIFVDTTAPAITGPPGLVTIEFEGVSGHISTYSEDGFTFNVDLELGATVNLVDIDNDGEQELVNTGFLSITSGASGGLAFDAVSVDVDQAADFILVGPELLSGLGTHQLDLNDITLLQIVMVNGGAIDNLVLGNAGGPVVDITVDATGSSGAVVDFSLGVTDNLDPNATLDCDHPSGSTFPAGDTLVTCTATDAAGNTGTASFTVTVIGTANVDPVVGADQASATVDEGQPAANSGTVSDADGDTVTLTASAGIVTNNNDGTWSWSFAARDGPADSQTVTVSADDGNGGTASVDFTLVVNNVAPTLGSVLVPTDPININDQPVSASAAFSDPAGAADAPFSCTVDYGDGVGPQAGTVLGTSCVGPDQTYAGAGVYEVTIAVTDKDGGTGTATAAQFIVIYDPEGGFVTGGGWIDSPLGAYTADPSLTGKASFGFVSKYKKGANVPTGQTQFRFKAGNLSFHSSSYEWLVIAGARAQFKGVGTVNGAGSYGFMLTATDGALAGGGGSDKFRIKIWNLENGSGVVYDNQSGASQGDDPTTALGGGSIVIHNK